MKIIDAAAGFMKGFGNQLNSQIEREENEKLRKKPPRIKGENPNPGTLEDYELRGMKRGGKVRTTGVRKLHKGEMVLRKSSRSKVRSHSR